MEWPWSLLYQMAFQIAFQAGIVAFALSVYLELFGTLIAKNFLRSLMVVVILLAGGNLIATFLTVSLSATVLRVIELRQMVWWVLISAPTTVATLFGVWSANQGTIHAHSPD